ncbi:nucleolar protein 7-like [Eriocheir sinensis]|uniref:nucleolar protein 7-like n=1 Tax=Eriocheir sinensis TaxID=95602 RepID=UPI0021C7FEC8|nr:nucleolar protein 7-like [Eriocheir sinensis]
MSQIIVIAYRTSGTCKLDTHSAHNTAAHGTTQAEAPTWPLLTPHSMTLKTSGNRHITFDEDEDFENLPAMEPLSKATSDEEGEEEGDEESDSDAAPEEATITAGKEEARKEKDTLRSEADRRRQLMKEKRKQQHEKNQLQQEEKRKRLEERRLPQSLLEAAAAEQKARLAQREQGVPSKKKQGKKKSFSDSDGDDDGFAEDMDEAPITTDMGVKVRALNVETKKTNELSRRAVEFRQKALYGSNKRRMPSEQLREMMTKQMKSGKSVRAGVKR